jgi:hypothetical protein
MPIYGVSTHQRNKNLIVFPVGHYCRISVAAVGRSLYACSLDKDEFFTPFPALAVKFAASDINSSESDITETMTIICQQHDRAIT